MGMRFRTGLLLRCDGSRELGLGHLARSAVIAANVAPGRHCLVLRRDPAAMRFLEGRGLDFVLLPDSCPVEQEPQFLARLAAERDITTVILDCQDNQKAYVEEVIAAGLYVVDFEDCGPGRDFAHILVDSHLWPGTPDALYRGRALCGFGPDWAILDPSYAESAVRLRLEPPEKRLLPLKEVVVACGGTDPAGLTPLVLEQLDRLDDDFRITLAAGAGSAPSGPACLYHDLRILRGVGSLVDIFSHAQLAVVSGGISLHEALCLGLPVLVTPQHREQYVNASRFALRAAVSLVPPPGEPDHVERIFRALEQLIEDPVLRLGLAAAGAGLVDGKGLERLTGALGYLEATRIEGVLRN